jgi:hypothetical protein
MVKLLAQRKTAKYTVLKDSRVLCSNVTNNMDRTCNACDRSAPRRSLMVLSTAPRRVNKKQSQKIEKAKTLTIIRCVQGYTPVPNGDGWSEDLPKLSERPHSDALDVVIIRTVDDLFGSVGLKRFTC